MAFSLVWGARLSTAMGKEWGERLAETHTVASFPNTYFPDSFYSAALAKTVGKACGRREVLLEFILAFPR